MVLSSGLSTSEYHPYYSGYIGILKEVDLLPTLKKGKDEFLDFVKGIPDDKLDFSYADGKWTISEVLLHLIDAERVFQYRAFRFARNDKTALPGFEQDDYVVESKSNERTKEEILEEFRSVRESTILLFSSFNADVLKRLGTASNAKMSARALGFVICGHQMHHLKIIQERYL
nr:DinB family protein [Allomuricauda sp.]